MTTSLMITGNLFSISGLFESVTSNPKFVTVSSRKWYTLNRANNIYLFHKLLNFTVAACFLEKCISMGFKTWTNAQKTCWWTESLYTHPPPPTSNKPTFYKTDFVISTSLSIKPPPPPPHPLGGRVKMLSNKGHNMQPKFISIRPTMALQQFIPLHFR